MSNCNYCNCSDLAWIQLPSGKWCLHDSNGKAHECVIPYELYKHKIPYFKERDTVKSAREEARLHFETKERWKIAKWCKRCGDKIGFSRFKCICSK